MGSCAGPDTGVGFITSVFMNLMSGHFEIPRLNYFKSEGGEISIYVWVRIHFSN